MTMVAETEGHDPGDQITFDIPDYLYTHMKTFRAKFYIVTIKKRETWGKRENGYRDN